MVDPDNGIDVEPGQLERVVHPGPRAAMLGRDVSLEELDQCVGVVNALHERHLAAQVAAEGGLEPGLDRQQRVRTVQALGVHLATPVDVLEKLALVGPHGVFHGTCRILTDSINRRSEAYYRDCDRASPH